MECQEGATSNNSIGQHGIGDLDETGGVGAADVVDMSVTVLAVCYALFVNVAHDRVQPLVDRLVKFRFTRVALDQPLHETVDVVTGIVHLISLSKSGVCVSGFYSIHLYPSFVIPPPFHLCITFLTTSGNRPSNPNAIRICVICQGESTAPIPSSASVCRLGTAVPA